MLAKLLYSYSLGDVHHSNTHMLISPQSLRQLQHTVARKMRPLFLITPIIALLILYRLVEKWSRLRQAPRPFLVGLTDFWRVWHQYNGRLYEKLLDLHEKLGPIVRYGVRCISISNLTVVFEFLQWFSNSYEFRNFARVLVTTPSEVKLLYK